MCWNKNREYKYDIITKKVDIFLETMNRLNKSWKDNFLKHIKKIKIQRSFHLFRKRKQIYYSRHVASKPAIKPKRCPV